MKLVSSPNMTKQYFVAINLLGEWESMQMTVTSKCLLLNSKYWNGSRGAGFSSFPDTATSCNCLPCKHQLRSHQFCRQRIPKSLWQRWSPSSTWEKKIGGCDLAWISASSSSRKLHLRLGRRLKFRLIDATATIHGECESYTIKSKATST